VPGATGAEEGAALEIDNDALQLVANRPVSFRLYSSLTRTDDTLGQMLEFDAADSGLHMHAPLHAVIRFGKKVEERLIPVNWGAVDGDRHAGDVVRIEDQRQPLAAAIRAAQQAKEAPVERKAAAVVSEQALKLSLELIATVFSPSAKSPIPPEEVPSRLEQTMGLGKNSWPVTAIRQMADAFLAAADGRKKSPAYEIRWLNLAASACVPASAIRATSSASNRRAGCTRRG